MEFELELTAKTTDPGGIATSFEEQLAAFGETAVVEQLKQVGPYRVDSSSTTYWFEVRRTYKITI